MPEIAVVSTSKLVPDDEVAWACKAVDAQLREDFCPRWGIGYQPVNFYVTKKDLPIASGLSIIYSIVDSFDGLEDQAAFHSFVGVPFVKIGSGLGELSVLLSHEALETVVNPRCTRMFKTADGATAAMECADPVQGWTYPKAVTMFGDTRDVNVSAFVLPSYFEKAGAAPCVFAPGFATETVTPGAIAPGGYLPILTPSGWSPRFGSSDLRREMQMSAFLQRAKEHERIRRT